MAYHGNQAGALDPTAHALKHLDNLNHVVADLTRRVTELEHKSDPAHGLRQEMAPMGGQA
jgi:hypothetical protein